MMQDEAFFTANQIREHATARDCWVVIRGTVYNMTSFLRSHPGGAAAILGFAGEDATAAFLALHEESLLAEFSEYRVGKAMMQSGSPQSSLASKVFPHERFEHSGVQASRFVIAALKIDSTKEGVTGTRLRQQLLGQSEDSLRFRQKSSLASMRMPERDWLHVGPPEEYAAAMCIRRKLILEHGHHVVALSDTTLAAQTEVLHLVLAWLIERYPKRFRWLDGAVETLTDGYCHKFMLSDYLGQPLLLAALVIQEDLYLMSQVADTEGSTEFRLSSGVSCFSFDINAKIGQSMNAIHHPHVPGFRRHLLKPMLRMFSLMRPGKVWWRSNWQLTSYSDYVHHDFNHAALVLPEPLHSHSKMHEILEACGKAGASKLHWRAEYQTLQRLRKEPNFLLFTVRTYVDSLSDVVKVPRGARALATAIRTKYKGMLHYMQLGSELSQKRLLEYLDEQSDIDESDLLKHLPQPWERRALDDGTFAFNAEATNEMRVKHTVVPHDVSGQSGSSQTRHESRL